jgi:hypothetical protein
MSGSSTEEAARPAGDPSIPASRRQANRTAATARGSAMLLLPSAIEPDDRFGAAGRARLMRAYDLGTTAPSLPPGAGIPAVQYLPAEETRAYVIDLVSAHFRRPKQLRIGLSATLRWLEQFPGQTWEERWVSSGADAAPRSWRAAVRGAKLDQVNPVTYATNALMTARVLRPSYGWQLEARAGSHLPAKMFAVNDAAGLERLRALPEYQRALLRHQYDAEACLSRVMIRTGRRLEELQGEHLCTTPTS